MRPLARCPSFRRLSRAASTGVDGRLQLHLAECFACRKVMERLSILTEASRALPWESSTPAAVQDLEASILASAHAFQPASPLRSKVAMQALVASFAMVVAGVVLATWIVDHRGGTGPDAWGQLVASADARYERVTLHALQAGEPSTEIVHLAEGTIWLEVEKLGHDERFVVSTQDAEVEVRGTRFEVAARDGNLLRVSVQEGAVEVRLGGNSWLLLPGERWEPEPTMGDDPPQPQATAALPTGDPTAEAPPTQAPALPPAPSTVPRAGAAQRVPQPPRPVPPPTLAMLDATPPLGERAFSEGWTALLRGDPTAAAAHFGEVSRLGANPGLLADAAYWRIVALARSGAEEHAEREMEAFLHQHAGADREGEVALMLGLHRMRAGASEDARRLLEQAVQAGAEPLRSRAKEALLQLDE